MLEIVVSVSDKLYRMLHDNCRVNVNFELNTLPFKLMHQGINRMQENRWLNLVHPLYDLNISSNDVVVTDQFNTDLNAEQMIAVKSIVEQKRAVPYLIFGPPGNLSPLLLLSSSSSSSLS